MQLSRREFLGVAGWSVVAGATTACTTLPVATPSAPALVPTDWGSVRRLFDLSPDWLHLSQFFIVSHPRPVRDAVERYRREIDANPFHVVEHGMFGEESVNRMLPIQKAAAAYVGGRPEEIAITDSTTMGLGLIYNGLIMRRGQEILCTTHDHEVHHEAIRLAAAKTGALTRRVALYDNPATATVDEMVSRLRGAIRPRTRVIGLTWVHSSTGLKLPVRELTAVIAEANRKRSEKSRILIVLDGVHGFGNQDEDAATLGADFFIAGTHKWIMAPRGTGIIWAKPETWALINPTIASFTSDETYRAWKDDRAPGKTTADMVSPGGFKAYEHLWAMVEAFQFHAQLGRNRVAARTNELNTRCKDGLAQMQHVTLHTPRDSKLSAGIIAFEVKGMNERAVVAKLLEKRVIASFSPYKVSYARLAPSIVNNEAEVDAALQAVAGLA
jgi:selenocysteine lyase/cysteine desulfurase